MAEKKKRYNASIKITRDQGAGNKPATHWHKVGIGFETRTGAINLILTSLPILPSQWDGTIVLYPETEQEKRARDERFEKAHGRDDDDDDLPY